MGFCKALLLVSVVATVLCAVGIHWYMNQEHIMPDISKEEYWGPASQKKSKEDTSVRPFTINVPEDVLKDLQYRLKNTIYQTDLEDGSFDYGFQVSYMKKVVNYWQKDFDWRKQERLLNKFDHFKTRIEGLDVHFIHAKPKKPKGQVFPILVVHGWPGSVWEFYKMIPLLADHPGDIAFEVVCPSIPGYGYSDTPKRMGFDAGDAARIFRKLMERLGYKQFFVQGGDFGSVIVHIMTLAFPDQILGHHNNMIQMSLMLNPAKLVLGAFFPSLVLEPNETTTLYPFSKIFMIVLKESGYHFMQATRPDTLSMGLTDSPVGLASYVLEKFCQPWIKVRDEAEMTCDLTDFFTLDEVLTNVMIYWTNRNFVSSARFYKELYRSDALQFSGIPSDVPTGLAQFPNEAINVPKSFASALFTNVVQFTQMPAGGHFAALEKPDLLADDVISFVRKTVNMKNKKNK